MSVRCLLVDDNHVFLRAARQLLEREGIDVVAVASTGSEAVRSSGKLRPDVALVDIDLGEESGFDVARQLTEESRDGDPRVILISSYSADDFTELIADSPALSFLPKPDLSAGAIKEILAANGS
jgi:CheY-like chemotaxis protein